jgi:acyl transferase domain-containing protein/acyl carrier protein
VTHLTPSAPAGIESIAAGTDIAIVGMSGRFPGAADVAELWAGIRAARSGITRFTVEELHAAGVTDEVLADPGYVRAGSVIDGIDLFDAGFFGLGPKEAQILDPQQRLYLEHNWHALEDAGCDPSRFDGAIGVFGGCAFSSYLQNNLVPSGIVAVLGDLTVGLANDKDSLTTRVAHTLGLSGPSYSVQSYCSTSLVAVCAAATSLASFECDFALAGGVAVFVPHRVGYLYQPGGIAPPDGECRAFDEAGLGSPLGSGVGVVALRRLEDALAAGDRIYAVIRGWAVNNDGGRAAGFTAPSVQGQASVIAEALSSAGLSAADIDYVEAHGTGTALGDAVEIAALQQVFSGEECLIGSIKTNVGHLDRAAGVTGLIKTALALYHAQIPPTRNLADPNRQLRVGAARLQVVTRLTDWQRRSDRIRRAGVSAFGIGGTNAHVVLEEAPAIQRPEPTSAPEVLVWSARSAAAADEMTQRLAGHLADEPGALCDVAHTLQTGRRVFEHRRLLVASTSQDAVLRMREAGVQSQREGRTDRQVGFLIAGTGEQYPGMAADLYRREPSFAAVLDECRAILNDRPAGLDPLEEMLAPRSNDRAGDYGLRRLLGRDSAPETSSGESTDRLHPAMFAVHYALARLVMSWGIQPVVMAGYSLGEYVAACLSGVLTLESALALVTHRAQLITALPAGAMAAVPLSEADMRRRVERAGIAGVDIAAVNGRELTVIAGEPAAVIQIRALLESEAVPSRALATTHAFHSRMLDPIKAELTEWVAGNIPLAAPQIPYVSNVTGSFVTAEQAADPGYWAEHMCAPVRFDAGLRTLLDQPDVALLELGPGQSLGAMARGHQDCPPDRWRLVMPSLPAAGDPRGSGTVLAEAVGRLWLAGVPVDWDGYQADRRVAKVGLPGYPFQRQRYWIDAPAAGPSPPASQAAEPGGAGSQRPEGHVQLIRQQWSETAVSSDRAPTGRCVLLGAGPIADLLAASLRGQGADVVCVPPDADRAALAECFSQERPAVVVDLRALGSSGSAADGRDVVLPFAVMADALGSGGDDTTRIMLVTQGGQAIADGDSPVPGHAAAAGLAMVANQEYLNLECRVVDLDPRSDTATVAQALMAERERSSQDVLVAYRGGRRFVRGFAPADAGRSATAVAIRPGGTYLITGGLGDVGLLVAEHLVRSGATRLVLTSRSGSPGTPGDPRHEAIGRLRALGAEVIAPPVDVTDETAMRAVITEMLRDGGRLDGVIHAAADTRPETFFPLRYLSQEAVARHFAAKVTGARVLETLLAELPAARAPGFCLLFSSTSAVLGGLAFGSYAAANAALTAIGHANHVAGRPTRWIAASWDTWADTLERTSGGIGATMAAHAMTAQEGLAAFDRLLGLPEPGPIVVAAGLDDRMPRVSAVSDEPGASGARFPRPDLPQPYAPPLTATDRALAEVWSGVLGIEPVGTDDNFFDLGGNSLLALQMLVLVKKRFGIVLPAVTLFEAPTVHTLAAILDSKGTATRVAHVGVVAPGIGASAALVGVIAQPVPAVRPERSGARRADPGIDRRIAVVGMAGRFPGAGSAEAFWRNLRDGVESISFFSAEELIASGEEPSLIRDPGYVPARPVLDDISGFDAAFFGLSSRTAALTDPQQRLFLEVCWEALEQAGYAAPEHRGRVGVFGGCNISTYLLRMPPETFTGGEISTYEIVMSNDKDALTTTASYLFDLHGPSVAVQTFCSTSLVATHLAVQSLRSGECEMAMAGGVSIRVPDRVGHMFQPGGMESPDGHVRTFDAKAHGSMVGDGAAVVVLKRLADAVRDGDHIWSVIRGSAINNDGALKVGFTAPSVVGQARVIADAMADAGVTGEDVSYIEAHGTATELGDPIELAALSRAFGPTKQNQYCPIGSVKTNVGHLDRAAGVTALIKTSFALTHEVIPPSLHYTSPNPDIDFAGSPFYVNTELAPWRTRDGRRRLAGINSLGMGGTNVHVVLEQAPIRSVAGREADSGRRYQVLPVSARSATAVIHACGRLGEHLGAAPGTRLADVAYTLQAGRKVFEHRRVVVAADTSRAAAALSGADPADGLMSRADAVRGRPAAFLFTGAGEQYPGLVAELYLREPVFRAAADECLEVLRQTLPAVDLVDLLAGARGAGMTLAAMLGKSGSDADSRSSGLERTQVVQPALFTVEYALARTLMTWGVQPQAMLGYSIGEYVAACLAGVFSLGDALALVVQRAKLIATVAAGSMVAVPLPAQELRSRFSLAERELDVAAVNGPAITVVAGPVGAVSDFVAELRLADIPCRALQTTHAFHSRMLDQVSDELTEWVRANITLRAPRLPYISNVTGGFADADLVCDPGYWARHMCQTVQFQAGVQTLAGEPELAIVEIGPGQSLGAMIRAAGWPPERWPLILSVLPAASDTRSDDAVLTDCLARLWLLGVDVDWVTYHGRDLNSAAADDGTLPGRIPLPTYPFQRQRYWFDGPSRVMSPARPAGAWPAPGDSPSIATLDAIAGLPKLPEEQWLHLPVWRQTAAPAAAARQPASWLVYTRDGAADDVVAELCRTITAAGATLCLVRPGETYAATDGGYLVRPGSVDDAISMLRDLRAAGRPLERVVHLWSIDAAPNGAALAEGLHTLVALARAAGGLGLDAWSLDVVASGTQQVYPDDPASPYAATLTGPCRVIPLEYPRVTTRLIDVTPDPAPAAIGALVDEIYRPQSDPTVALRRRRRWVPGYEAMAAAPRAGGGVLRQGGVYLITGGLGGIGLAMAANLARQCQAKLVLLGRHGLPERATWPGILQDRPEAERVDATTRQRVAKVAALLDLGAEVEIVIGDVSDRGDVRRACQAAVERFGALHGVLHVAGVPSMGLMQFKSPQQLDAELASKVAGTLALGEALRIGQPDETELDFLVFFSSITSTTGGGPGQVGYCAANAFLDAYACQLAAPGRKVVAVNWSEWTWNAWDDGLTGYADALQTFFRANRARIGIDFDAGWRSLLRVLACDEPRVVVSTQDFPTMVRFGAQFTVEAVTSRALAGTGARHPRPDLMTVYQEPSDPTEETIAGIWGEALRLEQVGVQDSFFDLGGNSLLGVSIVAALRTAFALADLPPHILYEAPTVAALGKFIDTASAGGSSGTVPGDEADRHVRAQLRRSGLDASAARRRGR